MRFIVRNWEIIASVFVVLSLIYWLSVNARDTVAPDRYTATDAAEDLAVIERQIEVLQIEVMR